MTKFEANRDTQDPISKQTKESKTTQYSLILSSDVYTN